MYFNEGDEKGNIFNTRSKVVTLAPPCDNMRSQILQDNISFFLIIRSICAVKS